MLYSNIRMFILFFLSSILLLSSGIIFADSGVEPLEAGDPGYLACKQDHILQQCFRLKLEGGQSIKLTERDFDLPPKTQLAVYERHHPFKAEVAKYNFTISVPDHYLWAEVRLKTIAGKKLLLLVYSDRSLARAALANFERQVQKKPGQHTVQTFYAEKVNLNQDKLDEIIIYGGSGRLGDERTTAFSMITSWNGKRSIHLSPNTYPDMSIYKVNQKDGRGPLPVVIEGHSGCTKSGHIKVWRLKEAGEKNLLLNTEQLGTMYGLPPAWKKQTPELWINIVHKHKVIQGIDLFENAQDCSSQKNGVRIFWRNGSPRGRHL